MKAVLLVILAGSLAAQVSFERILSADKEPGNWLTYSRTLNGQRFSPLSLSHRDNVARLKTAWIYQSWSNESRARFETSPSTRPISRSRSGRA